MEITKEIISKADKIVKDTFDDCKVYRTNNIPNSKTAKLSIDNKLYLIKFSYNDKRKVYRWNFLNEKDVEKLKSELNSLFI